ncbi:hypothetical protein A2U01_0063808 [Trifolium medium]|uniref:Uncharacterized protein n=1 Tax=Trifolium medium TaxID=97028 RepID=A0A392S120_9FABA|nr:hypothetical protein [Trifolium medium]
MKVIDDNLGSIEKEYSATKEKLEKEIRDLRADSSDGTGGDTEGSTRLLPQRQRCCFPVRRSVRGKVRLRGDG